MFRTQTTATESLTDELESAGALEPGPVLAGPPADVEVARK